MPTASWPRAGGDPLTDKRRAEGMPTFAQAAAKVYEMHRPGWRNAKYAAQWEAGLRAYAYGRIGEMPVSEVTTAEVLEVLGPIWHDKPRDRTAGAGAHRRGDEVGYGAGVPWRQPGW